jgi:signal transduction histidine kinase
VKETEDLQAVKRVLLHLPEPAILVQGGRVTTCNESAKTLLHRSDENGEPGLPYSISLPQKDGVSFSEISFGDERYGATAWDIGEAVVVTLHREYNRSKSADLGLLPKGIRRPLSNLLACVKLLLDRLEKVADRMVAENTAEMIKNLYQIIWMLGNADALVECSGEGKLRWHSLVDISSLLRKTVEESLPYASVLGISIVYEGPAKNVKSYCSKRLIRRALLNLIANALEYADRGGTVRVKLSVLGKILAISVIDDGAGISPEKLQMISETRLQTRGADIVSANAGIGLPLVRCVARLHGGTLMIQSRIGHGTMATMTIKAHAEETDVLSGSSKELVREEFLVPPAAYSRLLPIECYMYENL